jgi:hypothetical protein
VCCPKLVEQLRNIGIINSTTQSHLVGSFYEIYIKRLRWSRGSVLACLPSVPKFAGSHLAEAVGFLGRINPQHAFLRRGSKVVGPMS